MPRRNRRQHHTPRYVLPRDGSTFIGTQEMEGPSWARGEIFKVRGVFAAQEIKPQARTLAGDRGFECVTLDYDELRGIESAELRLF